MSAASKDSNTDHPGGEASVAGIEELKFKDAAVIEPKFDETRHRAETAGRLAFTLVAVLAGILALHYLAYLLLTLSGRASSSAVSALSDFLHVWLPALTGIVSAAVTYYFTKEK